MTVMGLMSGLRLLKTKKGDRMAACQIDDFEGSVEALIFPEAYRQCGMKLKDDESFLVRGKLEMKDEDERPRLIVSDMTQLDSAMRMMARSIRVRVDLATLPETRAGGREARPVEPPRRDRGVDRSSSARGVRGACARRRQTAGEAHRGSRPQPRDGDGFGVGEVVAVGLTTWFGRLSLHPAR